MGKLVSIFPDLIEGQSKIHGKGVFAGKQFNSGDEILEVPSERIGLLNHSCDPSAAFVFTDGRTTLKAIRPVKPMMEITVDYTLTATEDPRLVCSCGTGRCRKAIGLYSTLPAAARERYEWMKIVPDYVVASTMA